MSYIKGTKPSNVTATDFLAGSSFNLLSDYTFAHGDENPATAGVELILFFKEIETTESWAWVNTLKGFITSHAASGLKIAAVLYGSVDDTWLRNQLSAQQINFTVIRDSVYSTSITKNFAENFGPGKSDPFYYLVSKECRICEKRDGLPLEAMIIHYLSALTSGYYNTLPTVSITFSEPVLDALVGTNYTLSGSGRGSIPVHPVSVAADGSVPNKYNLTLGAGTPGDGPLVITMQNITEEVFASRVALADNAFTYTMDITGPVVTITSTAPSPTGQSLIPVQLVISDDGSGLPDFSAADLQTIINSNKTNCGTVTDLALDAGASTVYSRVYNFQVRPSDEGYVTIAFPAGMVHDRAGNANSAATAFNIVYARPNPYFDEIFVINSLTHASGRIDILYNRLFSGVISYIISVTDLGIKDSQDFNACSESKTSVVITSDKSDNTPYDDYISITDLAPERVYYVFIMEVVSGKVRSFKNTTSPAAKLSFYKGTITGYNGNPIEYIITTPSGYKPVTARADSDLLTPTPPAPPLPPIPSDSWPLLLSINAPNFTSNDANFYCITLSITLINISYEQLSFDSDAIMAKLDSIINGLEYNIDKKRIYACGFDVGGNAVMRIANNAQTFRFSAIAVNGIAEWIYGAGWVGNLGNTNIWISCGQTDPCNSWKVDEYMPKISGDHYLSVYPGVEHQPSITWDSPYTFLWLLSK